MGVLLLITVITVVFENIKSQITPHLYTFSHKIKTIFFFNISKKNRISWNNKAECYWKWANKQSEHYCCQLLMSWNLLIGGSAHPLCAGCRRPQLFLDLLPDLLHCHLGLLDGSLGCVKSAGREEHKVTNPDHCLNHTPDHNNNNNNNRMLKLCFQEATKLTGCVTVMTTVIYFISLGSVMWLFGGHPKNFDCLHVKESLCSVFVIPPCFFFGCTGGWSSLFLSRLQSLINCRS